MPEYNKDIESNNNSPNGAFTELDNPFAQMEDNERPNPATKEKVTTSYNMVRGIFASVEGVLGMFTSLFKGFFK